MSRQGLWIEAKDRVVYGRTGDDGDRYLPFPSRRRNVVERIRAMYGRRPVDWAPLLVHVLTVYHQEVQRIEEGSEKGRNLGENLRMCCGRRGIRKWWAKAPGAPGKGPKNLGKKLFPKKYRKECVLRSVRSE